jgi:DNA (cytosine-5)-methyltransferase 1
MVGAFDFDPIHVGTHAKNFPNVTSVCADIRQLTGKTVRRALGLPDSTPVDVVIGGPPCQGFSMIGKRNMNDPRNLLLGDFARIVKELAPRYFVMENVAGLMYGEARNLLAACLRDFRVAGYRWITPVKVLDAADFGIPQRRKRLIVVGYRADQKKPKYPRPAAKIVTVKQAIGDLVVLGRTPSLFKSDVYAGKLGKPSAYARSLRNNKLELTGCLRAAHSKEVFRRFRSTKPGKPEPVSHFMRLHEEGIAPTLRAGTSRQYGSFTAARPIHPTQARCITVREAARLHTFPDWFRFHPTQWHGFRQIGNAVPPILARAVARSLRRAMDEAR